MEQLDTLLILKNSNLILEEHGKNIIINKKLRTSVVIPRAINLKEELLRAIYLFWGDGSYIQKIHFTNKEHELHSYIIKMFEKYFAISKNTWRLRILYNELNGRHVTEIKSQWLKSLGFSKTQLYPKIGITGYKANKNGNGRIIIDKLTYGDFIRNVIDHTNFLINNKSLSEIQLLAILDGILNAEGSALIDNIGLHKVVITINQKEMKLVRNILSQLGINDIFLERQGKLTVMGWRNLYKFARLYALNNICPFSLHSIRKKNFIEGFLNHKRTVALNRYLSFIEKNEGLSPRKLASISYRDVASVHVVIFERLKEFTNIYGGGKAGNPYKIYLSKDGREFLQTVRKMKEWR